VLVVTLGAVNRPPVETTPAVAVHTTAVLLVPCTVALNCLVPPDVRLALVGDTATLMPVNGTLGEEIVICSCNLLLPPTASLTFTQKFLVTAIVGVPVIAPVFEFRTSPDGNAPAVVENV
jgi:hypothetical protein